MRALWRLCGFGREERARLAAGALAAAAAALCGVALLATSGWLIDRAAQRPGSVLALSVATASVRGFALGRGALRYAERLVSHDAAFRVLGRARTWFWHRLEPLVPGAVPHSGDVLNRMVGDMDVVQDVWLRQLLPSAAAVLAAVFSVALATHLLAPAGAVLAGGLAAGAVVPPALAWRWQRSARRGTAALRGRLAATMVDLAHGAADLAAYGAGEQWTARALDTAERISRAEGRRAVGAGLSGAAGLLVGGLTFAGVLAVGVAGVAGGRMPGVDLAALGLLSLAAFEPLGPVTAGFAGLDAHLEAAGRLMDLADAPVPVADPVRPAVLPAGVPELRLSGASVRYGPDRPWVLAGVDFVVPPGRRVAVVGESGAGKTTLAEVLVRFRDLDAGRYTVGGLDATDLLQDDVRRQVVLVPQEVHLFNSSLRANLRLGRVGAADADLVDVLELVGLGGWFCSLEAGLDTPVGERGGAVSGGERRRLALARAVLAGPSVLVLDEPTSHLDPDTAVALMDDVLRATAGRSLVVITHEPYGLADMDQVVGLARGRVMAGERAA